MVGKVAANITTSSVELAQAPLLIVQRAVTLLPIVNPVIEDVGDDGQRAKEHKGQEHGQASLGRGVLGVR